MRFPMETAFYSELTKTSTALARLAVTCVLSAARRLVLIFVNSLYMGIDGVRRKKTARKIGLFLLDGADNET